MKALYYGDTNIGNIRPKNEDAFVLKEVWGGTHLLAVVVDAVGGNGGGDFASDLAVRCISEHFRDCMHSVNSIDVLQSAVIFANNSIYAQHYSPWSSQMSCVLTAVLFNIETGQADICHVGDTRMYTFKNGVFTKITRDHSLVGPLEESGEFTELQAMRHPQRNIITRSVGKDILQWGTEYIQTHTITLEPDTTLLLCSDGLYDMVHSSQTVEILSEPISVDKRVDKLIDAALEAGGKDNVTVIVIDLMK
jgi:serine/threonine protein phosphatase PrpC